MRLIIPSRIGFRGAGLGNEAMPWCKAFLCAEAVKAKLLGPAWGINPRKYHQYFRTSRFDWLLQLILTHLPLSYEFTEEDYNATGLEDMGEAFYHWAEAKGLLEKKNWVVSVGGMWGGYWAIRRAKDFFYSKLAGTRYTQENLLQALGPLVGDRPLCAVHLRGDDFDLGDGEVSIQGRFNITLPYDWYEAALDSVVAAFSGEVDIFILTNDKSPNVQKLIKKYGAHTTENSSYTDISDLLILTKADILIPSISSFSSTAIFLNSALHYFWPRKHLTPVAGTEERFGIWAQTESQIAEKSPTRALATLPLMSSAGRCIPFSQGDIFPEVIKKRVLETVRSRARYDDLINYGSCQVDHS